MVYICPDTFSGHSSFRTLNMADTRYRINSQKIAAETIEGEVVIVNFVNGNYYSLNNLAADVWNWLVDAHTVTEIVAHLRTVFPEMDGHTIDDFVNALVKDDLLEHDPSLTAARITHINIQGGASVCSTGTGKARRHAGIDSSGSDP
jgi:hypothetical protein